ncbi:DNA repair protein RecN [Paracoccus methylarcula]|uniref:DNA repair protein RecN n=1 Tax=Paracoccus methylarcula TaxID=72022 RepID=A0A422QSP5_9RHOB|nr:DNA repair protein RecN [Paracoccus methylarcula]RNF33058.1 DNA repair protein RecN [Paracoccus methylarcula]
MLQSLEIRNMLLIDRLELCFAPGLNVLTGETGAGKSILLDCLGFVLGWRGRADLVRQGAVQGEVTAVFDLPAAHPARAVLAEAGIEIEEDELILRRVNGGDGRKTGWVNDRRVSGEVLRQLSELLVELHGQHDDRGLLNPRGHRILLDAFGRLDLSPVRQAWAARREARSALAAAEAELVAAREEEEFLRHAVRELEDLAPQPGEEAELDTRRRQMQAAARIREDVERALRMLGPEGAEGAMLDANRWLEGAADAADGRLDEPVSALSRALIELGEAHSGVEAALSALDFNPSELDATEERLFALRALARKHDVLADDLAGLADTLRERLDRIDAGEDSLTALRDQVAAADGAYQREADGLGAARTEAARRLDKAVMAELAPLRMERAIFETGIERCEPGPDGQDSVAFTVATNPGAAAGPLDKIASGGELSRFLLALKVCLARGNSALVMIFDEIDRGVGGATADAVGRRLKKLAADAQILVVTHSPQVAALGDQHFHVSKSVEDGMTTSVVTELAPGPRVDEIARMLSGDRITDAATAAARALLEG